MIIAIGTKNNAKVQGFTSIVQSLWPDVSFELTETNSGISAQPLNMEEIISGAINRAKHVATIIPNADYSAGIGGGVFRNNYGMFLGGWVALLRKDGVLGLGGSALVQVPEDLAVRLDAGEEMGPITQQLFNDHKNNIRHSNGTSGILTKDLYTRSKEFEDATRCALAKFVSPEYYSGNKFDK